MGLSFGSQLTLTGQEGRFLALDTGGFVPVQHLREIGALFTDPVAVAARFIGTPYLWGGNSRQGIDCSGLVQMACHACGFDCPGDSDMQAAGFGRLLGAEEELRRGDLLFWKGHVAFVAGPDLILHANGNDMAVTEEGMTSAIARIAAALSGLNLSPASRARSSRAAALRLPSGACPRAGPASPPPRPCHRRW